MDLGYARVSTTRQDLDRQIDALTAAGVAPERIWLDKKSGATTDRPGLSAVLEHARPGDVIVVHTLDRLGRTVRDTLNLIHDLTDRGVGLRNLADPIKVDTADPDDPMGQLAFAMLALFAQMERTYTVERTAHARAVATAKGRRVGRPSVVDPAKLAYATHLRDTGVPIGEIVTKTEISRATLYRHLPPRPTEQLTAGTAPASTEQPAIPLPLPAISALDLKPVPDVLARPANAASAGQGEVLLEAVGWPRSYSPACPQCARPTGGLREQSARIPGVREPVIRILAQPCGCPVDDQAAALQTAAPAPLTFHVTQQLQPAQSEIRSRTRLLSRGRGRLPR
jgi:DNA invertase Pin-like site-specific DNA recombinase